MYPGKKRIKRYVSAKQTAYQWMKCQSTLVHEYSNMQGCTTDDGLFQGLHPWGSKHVQ